MTILKKIDELISNWNSEKANFRRILMDDIKNDLLESVEIDNSIISKGPQLTSQLVILRQKVDQESKDLNTRYRILIWKFCLSILGMIVGLAVLFYLIMIAIRKMRSR